MTAESGPPTPSPDVRMRGFTRRSTVEAALTWVDSQAAPLGPVTVPLSEAAGRVLAQDITSPVDVPGFDRSMMDGYAVHAADTQGATAYNPLTLRIVGESVPGRPFAGRVEPGHAARIMTGAPIPDGADAVLPVEHVQVNDTHLSSGTGVPPVNADQSTHRLLTAHDEVPPGKNIGRVGEDVAAGTVVLQRGRCLRPQDLGVLSSIGVATVPVYHRPRVRIVVTGNELLPPGSTPTGHQIADANSPMLDALVARDGGIPLNPGLVPDQPEQIAAALHDDADVILVSGGSSVGQDDHAPMLLARHGELAIHGIAMRPSSPAGMGRLEHRLVFLLPGNPVSCLCAYDFFAGRAIRALAGRILDWPYHATTLPLRRKLVSTVGRVDYARVQIIDNQVEPIAISGASVLSSTTRADGFVIVAGDSEGYPAGANVQVHLYD